ncbi:MAG: hybrid sensor histidine kinase/response regulator [Desulfobulbaceae bacterium]
MNSSPSPQPAIFSYKTVIAAMLAVLLTLLVLIDFVLIRQQRREYMRDAEAQMAHQLNVAATFMTEPLLKYQFADVEQFLQQWFDHYDEILLFEAITPAGHVLKSLKRQTAASLQLTRQEKVVYNDEHLLTLILTRDFSATEIILVQMRNRMMAVSLFITAVLGLMLWLVFRRLALQPLETEIARRQRAESRLEETNITLEERIKARTTELEEKNEQLSGEIRQRREAEHTLATEKERLSVTLRSIGDGVITTDLAARVVFLNKVAEVLTGWSQQEAAGQPLETVFRIVDEKSGKPRESPVDKVLRTRQIVELANHTALIAKDGRMRSIADSGAPIRDRDSRTVGVVLVFRDISEKARLEREMEKMRKLESVGLLAGGIAHDFNNLLVGIVGNISLGREFVKPEDKIHPLLLGAEKAALRATELTRQLLTFSKGGDPVRETDSIAEIIRESASFVLHGGNVACTFAIPEDLWLVDVDRGQMSQVIQNIIINARQAMPDGGSILISCENIADFVLPTARAAVPGKYVEISIQDSGIGIPEKYFDRVFDPYFSTKKEGSGLGLAICHSIITRHDGHIAVHSKQGEGTTFTIHLPASEKGIRGTKTAKGRTPAAPAKILVMDDEETVLEVVQSMLAHLGHKVFTAKEGAEAVTLYEQHRSTAEPFDLLLMDLTIPGGMGGKEAVAHILAIDPQAKVAVSSGYSNDPVMANYTEYGFCAAIVKPYKLAELAETINSVLA